MAKGFAFKVVNGVLEQKSRSENEKTEIDRLKICRIDPRRFINYE